MLARLKVVSVVGAVVSGEERPSKVSGSAGLVDFVKPGGAALVVRAAGVGPHFAPVKVPCGLVDADTEGVAVAHDVNFRAGFGRSGRKEISFGNGDGAVGLGMDTQDFASKIVGVGGGFLSVPRFAVRAFVDGAVAVGFARVCVVAGGGVQVARGVKGEGSS